MKEPLDLLKENRSERDMVLVRVGEIMLKGLNRYKFEDRLITNMRYRLSQFGKVRIEKDQSRILVEVPEGVSTSAVIMALKDVFGLVSLSPLSVFSGDFDAIKEKALTLFETLMSDRKARTFKVETKRVLKTFPHRSYDVSAELGALLVERFPDLLSVDVHEPDVILRVEIRNRNYLYHEIVPGPRGLPVGMSGTGMLLLSGGIDSPVAGYMMASRGMNLESIYFHTYPYTGDEVLQKVRDLGRIMTRFTGDMPFHVCDFTTIQLELQKKCPNDMLTVVMRRMMMRIAEGLTRKTKAKSLITGESLGQVASQTQEALIATGSVVSCPIFRPLIGVDKDDTVRQARAIGTFETSILPFADCCTVFVSKHPKTHPSLKAAEEAEAALDIAALTELGLEHITSERLSLRDNM